MDILSPRESRILRLRQSGLTWDKIAESERNTSEAVAEVGRRALRKAEARRQACFAAAAAASGAGRRR